MADYSELKRKAQEIRDEVKAGANTANRVGLALEEAVKALEAENQRAEQAEVSLENAVQMLQDETEDLPSIREQLETLVVNDLTTGGADKALSAEMGKVLGETSIVDLGETTLEAVNARMREDALPSAERRTMVYKWRFADGGSGFGLSVARLTWWGYCQYRAYNAVVEYRTVSGSGTPSDWLAWSGTHIKYDPTTRKIGLAKWSDTGNETIQNSGETAELPLATDSQDGLMSKTQAAKLSGAASSTDLAKKQDKLLFYTEDLDNLAVKIRGNAEISMDASYAGNIATLIAYNLSDSGRYIPIARLQASCNNGDSAKFEARGNEAIIASDYVIVNGYDLMEVIEGYMNDGVELLENGNIKLTLKGTTKEFMPATPSGDPMHYAYETAGAVYNGTTDFIVKNAPWKDMVDTIEDKAKWGFDVVDASQVKQMTIGGTTYNYVQTTRQSPEGTIEPRYFLVGQASDGTWVEDETKVLHLPGHWYLNGLGDITGTEIALCYTQTMPYYTTNILTKAFRVHSDSDSRTLKYRTTFRSIRKYSTLASTIECESMCYSNTYIEIFILTFMAVKTDVNVNGLDNAFTNAHGMKYLIGQLIAITSSTYPKNIRVLSLAIKYKADFSASTYVSKPSILYTINNAIPTTAITITLHADRYAQLSEDADIVAALEAKNTALEGTGGSVSLVSA